MEELKSFQNQIVECFLSKSELNTQMKLRRLNTEKLLFVCLFFEQESLLGFVIMLSVCVSNGSECHSVSAAVYVQYSINSPYVAHRT